MLPQICKGCGALMRKLPTGGHRGMTRARQAPRSSSLSGRFVDDGRGRLLKPLLGRIQALGRTWSLALGRLSGFGSRAPEHVEQPLGEGRTRPRG